MARIHDMGHGIRIDQFGSDPETFSGRVSEWAMEGTDAKPINRQLDGAAALNKCTPEPGVSATAAKYACANGSGVNVISTSAPSGTQGPASAELSYPDAAELRDAVNGRFAEQ